MSKVWHSIAEIRAANEATAHHWFSPDTMKFFGSRVASGVINGRYFITSEIDKPRQKQRRYTIRVVDDQGRIDTVGKFQAYDNVVDARNAALAIE